VPYYREVFRKIGFDPRADFSFADYRRLPPLEKQTVIDRLDGLIAEGFTRETMREDSTAGSTGTRVRFWLDERCSAWRNAALEWGFAKTGFRSGDRMGLIWGVPTGPLARNEARTRVANWLTHRKMMDCYHLSNSLLDEIDQRMSAYKPEFLWCYTSPLTLLAHRLRERGKRPDYPRQAIVTGAEKLDATQRRIIEEVFSVPVHESYGSRDCSLMAIQPDARSPLLRVAGASVLVEPYGDADPDAGTEIVVTDLHRMGMPFLRYRLGDRARFPSLPPDLPVDFLEGVAGRTTDFVSLPDGSVVHGVKFPSVFRDFDVREFQIVQESNGDVRVALVAGPRLSSNDVAYIERALRDHLHGVLLSVSLVPTIERSAAGKLRPVISHYRQREAFA
jgi:phenylacetate-CoA ligase